MAFNRRNITVLSIVLIVMILMHTNPTHQQYKNWVMMYKSSNETWNIETIKHVSLVYDEFSIRKDYIIFSLFKLNIPFNDDNNIDHKLVGFFNKIIEVNK